MTVWLVSEKVYLYGISDPQTWKKRFGLDFDRGFARNIACDVPTAVYDSRPAVFNVPAAI
jgi:hypothetical protein